MIAMGGVRGQIGKEMKRGAAREAGGGAPGAHARRRAVEFKIGLSQPLLKLLSLI
jgi:hypothetical protein